MSPLNTLPADAFKLLWLWLHQARGASSTLAELQTLTRASRHITKQALMALATEHLCTYNGLADHSVATPSLGAYSVFMVDAQPTDQPTTVSQPTGTRPCADQPTDHRDPAPNAETLQRIENPQIPLQKNFFSAKKIFSPTDEEEDLISIKLNNFNSSSSSQSGSPEKTFSTPAPDALPADYQDRLTALQNLAKLNSDRIRKELAVLPWATPEYITAMSCQFYHHERRLVAEAGMLRRRIADHWTTDEPLCYVCRPQEPIFDDDEIDDDEPTSLTPDPLITGWTGPGINPLQAWHIAINQLQAEMPKATFDNWVRPTRFAGYDHGQYTIYCPDSPTRSWCHDRLATTLTRIITGCLNQPITVEFVSE